MIEGDRGFLPEGGELGREVAKNIIASRRNDDPAGAQFACVNLKTGLIGAIRTPRVLVQISPGGKTGRQILKEFSGGRIVVQHHHHGHVVGRGPGGGGAVRIPVVPALVGEPIRVAPQPPLESPGKIPMNLGEIGDPRIAVLSEITGIGMPGEGTAGVTQHLRMGVPVGVHQTKAGARVVDGMLELDLGGVVIVVTVRVHYPVIGCKPPGVGPRGISRGDRPFQVPDRASGISEIVVQTRAKFVVDQPHAGIDVAAVAWRGA